jgi:oxalate decarboxylase/phosphoglucose isomerase-like protein (cupin superfamily)
MIELADSSMAAHVSEFEVGKYKKAHKHGPGAHVIIIAGEGFSLMWPEGQEPMKFDWRVGSVIVPPDQWFHQHFNTGTTPAKYLALRWNSKKYKVFKQYAVDVDRDKGGSQIESDAEDPQIRILFEAELARNGVVSQM